VTSGGHPKGSEEYGKKIYHNMNSHHMGFSANFVQVDDCDTCHVPGPQVDPNHPDAIRYCQSCHAKETLHAIHQQNRDAWEAVGFHVLGRPEADPDTYRTFSGVLPGDEMCGGCHGSGLPVLNKLNPKSIQPGEAIRIIGSGFGDTQGTSVVHIGGSTLDASSPRIRLWTDTKINIRIPKKKYDCDWFAGEVSRGRKVWVTVDGGDSNMRKLTVIKPDTCP
jgi:hypothetical protein